MIFAHEGVWCCERGWQCKWQGYALHQGLSWGTVPTKGNVWLEWHKRECGGELIQLIQPVKDKMQLSDRKASK